MDLSKYNKALPALIDYTILTNMVWVEGCVTFKITKTAKLIFYKEEEWKQSCFFLEGIFESHDKKFLLFTTVLLVCF